MKMDDDVKAGECHTRYHAISRGFFVDVLIYKVDGRRARDYIQQEIVRKVEGAEFYLGCPPEYQYRMAECIPAQSLLETAAELLMHRLGIVKAFYHPGVNALEEAIDAHDRDFLQESEVELTMRCLDMNSKSFKALVMMNDFGLGAHHNANSRGFRGLPLLSVTGATNSRSIALMGAQLACGGGTLLSSEGLEKALGHEPKQSYDELLNKHVTYVNCGWTNDRLGQDWVGWAGAGGSIFVFSPKYRASIGYIPTKLEGRTHKPNGSRMLKPFTKILEKQHAMQQLA
jgi:hypothetical protein